MDDDAEVIEMDAPRRKGMAPPIHAGNAREMAERNAAIQREARKQKQEAARNRAKLVAETMDEAELAAMSRTFDDRPIEELADFAVRKMAKVVILGGKAFLPTSLKEATDAAAGWAQIAYKEAARRKALEKVDEVEESPVAEAARALKMIRSDLAKKSKAAGE